MKDSFRVLDKDGVPLKYALEHPGMDGQGSKVQAAACIKNKQYAKEAGQEAEAMAAKLRNSGVDCAA